MMRDKSALFRSVCLGSLLAASACSFAPDYQAPEVAVPPAYEEAGDWMPATPADAAPKGNWWVIFNDPALNDLEDQVTAANQNLKFAVSQYDEARALAGLAEAAYFPTLTGNAGYEHDKVSKTVANPRPTNQYNDYLMGGNLSYEVDVWGRVRNAAAAGVDRAQASAADLATIDLSLHAELAKDYILLRGYDSAQAILDQTVQIDEKSLQLVKNRFLGGVTPEVDYDQAQLQLQNARTQAADMRINRAQMEHAIATLIGKVPAAFHLPPMPLGIITPPPVNAGLPSTLLQRRPDVAAAERRVAAANAEIGVARAAFFPTFSLTAILGLESANPSRWLQAPSTFWSLGPSSALTIIDGGALAALSDQAHAQYDENVAAYRQTVLSAYQDVEDNLAALHHLSEESVTQAAAVDAAERTYKQENYRYAGGAAIYIDVATVQNAALQAELNLVNVRVRWFAATVQLFKALGGGWDYRQAFVQSPSHSPAQVYTSRQIMQPTQAPSAAESAQNAAPVPPAENMAPAAQTAEPIPTSSLHLTPEYPNDQSYPE